MPGGCVIGGSLLLGLPSGKRAAAPLRRGSLPRSLQEDILERPQCRTPTQVASHTLCGAATSGLGNPCRFGHETEREGLGGEHNIAQCQNATPPPKAVVFFRGPAIPGDHHLEVPDPVGTPSPPTLTKEGIPLPLGLANSRGPLRGKLWLPPP